MLRRPAPALTLAFALALAGCSGDDGETSATSSTSSTSSTTDLTSSTTASTGEGSSSGAAGGCTVDDECDPGMVCAEHDDGMCGAIEGSCEMYPATCGEHPHYTACGCDGEAFEADPCSLKAGKDLRDGACAPAAGQIWCGDTSCAVADQYCSETLEGVLCVDLPDGCAACDCLDPGVTECGCVDEPGGGVRVSGCSL